MDSVFLPEFQSNWPVCNIPFDYVAEPISLIRLPCYHVVHNLIRMRPASCSSPIFLKISLSGWQRLWNGNMLYLPFRRKSRWKKKDVVLVHPLIGLNPAKLISNSSASLNAALASKWSSESSSMITPPGRSFRIAAREHSRRYEPSTMITSNASFDLSIVATYSVFETASFKEA